MKPSARFGKRVPQALLWDGDSHTAETIPGAGNGYPSICLAHLTGAPLSLYTNIAISGATDFHASYDVNRGHRRIAVLLIGTNVYRVGGTAATVESEYTARMTLLRGVGYSRVLITTCPPSSLISGANETSRIAGNAALFALGGDGVIDLAGDTICGTVANYSNGIIGTDGTHASATGCIQWARVAIPIIQAAIAN